MTGVPQARNGSLQAGEQTPLLKNDSRGNSNDKGKHVILSAKSVVSRILLCAFMVSLSFGVTQVPLVYVFRVMACEAYYSHHPSPPPGTVKDRCSLPAIEGSTAKAVALLGASTTLCGLVNLFFTGYLIKKIGVKATLLIQVFWPAVRLAVQNVGVATGGDAGIVIVQASQIITIVGGPNGYLLGLNSFIAEVVEHEQRTPSLGRLQGAMFFGTSIGYLVGGDISERFGIIWPFRVTLGLFCLSTMYVFLALPFVPIPDAGEVDGKSKGGLRRFFGPLKILAPQKWVLLDGRTSREFGPILLAIGAYLGILATGYIPMMLQLISTDIYGFGTRDNGILISMNSMLRGLFLTFIFPHIISVGRKYVSSRQDARAGSSSKHTSGTTTPFDATSSHEIDVADAMEGEREPLQPQKLQSKQETFDFDLIYTRYSLLLDGILTGCATFISHGWQIYLVAAVLPFAAGTAASSKGTILQMCPPRDRTDALSAITLVENMARLTTTSIFGLVFAAFASIQKTYLVFTINGATALLGFFVLLFARFPARGAQRLVDLEDESDDEGNL